MGHAIDFIALLRQLPHYLLFRTTLEAVFVPIILSVLFFCFSPKTALPKWHGLVFLLGTMFSAVFSIHRQIPGLNALYAVPGYALLIQFLPSEFQPTWYQAFLFSFLSLLLTDLWCAASWSLSAGALPADFYYGVGGAGFHDLLFLGPWFAAVPLLLKRWLYKKDIAEKTLSECWACLIASARERLLGQSGSE